MEWTAFVLAAISVLLGFFAWWPARLLGDVLSQGTGQ
jgi:hypothetical protein